jgi:hypothetical protein
MAAEAGRGAASIPVTIWGAPDNLDRLKRSVIRNLARRREPSIGTIGLDPTGARPLGRDHPENRQLPPRWSEPIGS